MQNYKKKMQMNEIPTSIMSKNTHNLKQNVSNIQIISQYVNDFIIMIKYLMIINIKNFFIINKIVYNKI
jgi:hypothetical protein